MSPILTIDGSFGEGGGQVLRSSLALSLVTGTAFRIERIRANRKKSGLMRQHLTALQAAAAIGRAEVSGDTLGSRTVTFKPKGVFPGRYQFDVGSAGSCILVLQTLLPALMQADAPSNLDLSGGTHNPLAPTFDFLDKAFLPLMRRMGPEIKAELNTWGFYPAGGGRLSVVIRPVSALAPLNLLERGRLRHLAVTAWVAGLPLHIAEREIQTCATILKKQPDKMTARSLPSDRGRGPGNILLVELVFDAVTEVFCGFGIRGVRAEQVAAKLSRQVNAYLTAQAPVGPYLADQLLVPMARAGAGRFVTGPLSEHTRTNAAIVERFLPVDVRTGALDNDRVEVSLSSR